MHSLEAKLVGCDLSEREYQRQDAELHSLEAKLVGCDWLGCAVRRSASELHSLEAKLVGCDTDDDNDYLPLVDVAQPGSQTGRL